MTFVLPARGWRGPRAIAPARRGLARPHRGSIRGRTALGSGIEIADTTMVGPQPPILPLSVAATGDYKAVRSTPADGACGVHGYPCMHPGVDCGGYQGTVVNAPEDGTVYLTADGSQPPWRGYGPYLVLMLGKSGYYHLMAHLQPGSVIPAVGDAVTAGEPIATTSSANHTHWEVRKKPTPDYANNETNFDNNIDPVNDWLPSQRGLLAQISSGNMNLLIIAGGAAIALALYYREV
jgi:murein DD-endopeptidase MepM/ murein hydrolase activator NlpD